MGHELGDGGKESFLGAKIEIPRLGKATVREETKWSRTTPCVMVARL